MNLRAETAESDGRDRGERMAGVVVTPKRSPAAKGEDRKVIRGGPLKRGLVGSR